MKQTKPIKNFEDVLDLIYKRINNKCKFELRSFLYQSHNLNSYYNNVGYSAEEVSMSINNVEKKDVTTLGYLCQQNFTIFIRELKLIFGDRSVEKISKTKTYQGITFSIFFNKKTNSLLPNITRIILRFKQNTGYGYGSQTNRIHSFDLNKLYSVKLSELKKKK